MALLQDTLNGYYDRYRGRRPVIDPNDPSAPGIDPATGYATTPTVRTPGPSAVVIDPTNPPTDQRPTSRAYLPQEDQSTSAPPSGTGGAGATSTEPTQTSSQTTPTPTTTTTPPVTPTTYSYAGFDFARAQDPTRSAKDAFAAATKAAAGKGVAASTWATKEGAQAFAQQYIVPELEKAGYSVLEVRGDKMRIVTREDKEAGRTAGTWVDFVINAGGANPELGWQAETAPDATDPTSGWTNPTPGTTTAGTTTPTTTTTPTPAAGVPAWFDALYLKYLGRQASRADVEAWGGVMKWGGKEAELEAKLAADPAAVAFRNGRTAPTPTYTSANALSGLPYTYQPDYYVPPV